MGYSVDIHGVLRGYTWGRGGNTAIWLHIRGHQVSNGSSIGGGSIRGGSIMGGGLRHKGGGGLHNV